MSISICYADLLFICCTSSHQKGGKETILEEEFEFKGIEEEEEEESFIDMDRNSAEGDKEKGEERLNVIHLLIRLQLPIHQKLT